MKVETSTEEVARTLGVGRPRRTMFWRVGKWLLLALGVVVIVAALLRFGRPGPKNATRYVTADVSRGDLRVTISATGTLSALGAVEVGSEVSGRVLNVYVDYNQRVTKGQLLAELDPVQLRAEASQATAQLAANQAAIKTADATFREATQALERAQSQAKAGLIATKDVESAQAAHARAEASVASARASADLAQANVSSAKWKLTKAKIISPIDGVVLSRSVEPGQTVAATFQTPVLFKLATDLSALELAVQVDESDVGRIKEDLTAEFRVDAYPERVFSSRVKSVRNEAKTSSNVVYYEAILTVDNTERALRPGMTATATITSELRKEALRVPNAALRFEPPTASGPAGPGAGSQPAVAATPLAKGKKRIYLLAADGRTLTPVQVTPGASDGSYTEIRDASIKPGAKVVVDLADDAP